MNAKIIQRLAWKKAPLWGGLWVRSIVLCVVRTRQPPAAWEREGKGGIPLKGNVSGGTVGEMVWNTLPCYVFRSCAVIMVPFCGKHERGGRKCNLKTVKLEITLARLQGAACCRWCKQAHLVGCSQGDCVLPRKEQGPPSDTQSLGLVCGGANPQTLLLLPLPCRTPLEGTINQVCLHIQACCYAWPWCSAHRNMSRLRWSKLSESSLVSRKVSRSPLPTDEELSVVAHV